MHKTKVPILCFAVLLSFFMCTIPCTAAAEEQSILETDGSRVNSLMPFSIGERNTASSLGFFMTGAPDMGVYENNASALPGNWFHTSEETIAYCLDHNRRFSSGTVYSMSWNPRVGYWCILLNGYPCNTVFNGVDLSEEEARAATQMALWAFKMDDTPGEKLDLDSCYSTTAQGERVLLGARWLFNKARSIPFCDAFVGPSEIKNYLNFATIKGSNQGATYLGDEYLRFGAFTITSDLSTAVLNIATESFPDGWYYCDINGNSLPAPSVGTVFYIAFPRENIKDEGTASLHVKTDYLQAAALVWGEETHTSQDMGIVYNPQTAFASSTFSFSWGSVEARKVDHATGKPVSDTIFSLYFDNQGRWVKMGFKASAENGTATFGALPYGNYKIVEDRPNVQYATTTESGEAQEKFFTIQTGSTHQVQVFENDLIGLSCEVLEKTITKTSAAFEALPGETETKNVGREMYAYTIDYRNRSNVRADEFTVDNPLESVADGYVHITELWSPVASGDSDGVMNIWYKTNKTDDSTLYCDASAMKNNPYNANNPDNMQQLLNTGWKLWARDIRCDTQTRLSVAGLMLAEGEYVTAVRYEHGSVEAGFTTKDTGDWTYEDETCEDASSSSSKETQPAKELRGSTYLVSAVRALTPYQEDGSETLIKNDVQANIFRNVALSDTDTSHVETRVIGTSTIEEGRANSEGGMKSSFMSQTGDRFPFIIAILLVAAFSSGILLISRQAKHGAWQVRRYARRVHPRSGLQKTRNSRQR